MCFMVVAIVILIDAAASDSMHVASTTFGHGQRSTATSHYLDKYNKTSSKICVNIFMNKFMFLFKLIETSTKFFIVNNNSI